MEIIRSHKLSTFPAVMFGMSTSRGGVSTGTYGLNLSDHVQDHPDNVKENRRRFFEALDISADRIAFARQQHSSNCTVVTAPGMNEQCDALMTNRSNLFLAVSIADCTPVMVFDPVRRAVAGIHAGWRGTAGRIAAKAIERMCRDYGSLPRDLVVFIGPSAGACCYEVGEEVAQLFPASTVSSKESGKIFLDVKQANVLQLLECGVQNSNIEVNPDCSIHNAVYHSHRRDGKRSGRMLAIIGMKGS